MKLGIDLSPFHTESKYRGIGRYVRGFLQELIHIDDMDQFHFLNFYGTFEGDPKMNSNCFIYNYSCGPSIKNSGVKLLLDDRSCEDIFRANVDRFLKSSQIDAMLFLSLMEDNIPVRAEWFTGVFKIGILYDLIPLVFPDEYLINENIRNNYLASLDQIRQMDLLLAISEASKKDAVNLLGIPEEKIVVINAGVDDQFLAVANEAHLSMSEKVKEENPYLIYIGGTDFRKNIDKAIQAFAMNRTACEKNLRFIIAGRSTITDEANFMDIARRYGAADRVIFSGYVRDEDVVALYRNALALLFPSQYEGFGLPVLEAMCCGTAVITSNNSSLAEVAKGFAYLVDPYSIESISAGISALLEAGSEVVEERISNAKSYASTFRWRHVAQEARNAIVQVSEQSKPTQIAPKPFIVSSDLLQAIIQRYTRYHVSFRWPDALGLAKELRRMELGITEEGIRQGTRILYDVTLGRALLNVGSSTEEARISNQLRKALDSYAEVVPVTLKMQDDKCIFMRVDTGSFLETTPVEVNSNDIYLVAETQVRGFHVSIDYPSVELVRREGVKAYVVLYDILPIQMPGYYDRDLVNNFANYLNETLKSADAILTNSKTVTDDVMKYYHDHELEIGRQESLRVGYFHLGMDSFTRTEQDAPESVKMAFHNKLPVFLMVGTIEPRKNYELVLKTFTKLWRRGIKIKLCILARGRTSSEFMIKQIKNHSEFGRKLVLFEDVEDDALQYSYQNAKAMIVASQGEGFGLPIVEAACYRLPVICSDIPVFHEIAGDHAIYFTHKEDSLAKSILTFINSTEKDKLPDSSRMELETWDDTARRVHSMITKDMNWSYCD